MSFRKSVSRRRSRKNFRSGLSTKRKNFRSSGGLMQRGGGRL